MAPVTWEQALSLAPARRRELAEQARARAPVAQREGGDEGAPWERSGRSLKDIAATLRELSERMGWVPAEADDVVFAKELIQLLINISGPDGTQFLKDLGADTWEQLDLENISAIGLHDLFASAILSLPLETLEEAGWESVSADRGRARAWRRNEREGQ